MIYMFQNATSFNQNLIEWDVSSTTPATGGLEGMFSGASSFSYSVKKWCVSNFNSAPNDFSAGSQLDNSKLPQWGVCPSRAVVILSTNDLDNVIYSGTDIVVTASFSEDMIAPITLISQSSVVTMTSENNSRVWTCNLTTNGFAPGDYIYTIQGNDSNSHPYSGSEYHYNN